MRRQFIVAIFMPDDVAEEKSMALLCLGAKVEKVRPASIVDKKQVRGEMLSWHHSYSIETVRGAILPRRLLLAVHDEQNLAKQRAMEFGQMVLDDPENDLLVSSQIQSPTLIDHRNGATSLDFELENRPRGFFADQFEVNRLYPSFTRTEEIHYRTGAILRLILLVQVSRPSDKVIGKLDTQCLLDSRTRDLETN